MGNPWFRLYSEFADDPKVQMMPEAMQRRLVMLFCERCKGETLHETERAFQWRISEDQLQETKAIFIEKGFIDDEWNVLNWNKRQFLSDSSTDRVRRHRLAKKQAETFHGTSETRSQRSQVVTVAAPDTDTDTDTDADREEKPSPKPRKRVSEGRQTDPRHAEFKSSIAGYWVSRNPGHEMPWDGSEAKALAGYLQANPTVSIAQFTGYLRNRFHSEVNHAERPRIWIANASSYAAGPLDRFGQPLTTLTRSKTNGTGKGDSNFAVLERSIADDAAAQDGSRANGHLPAGSPGWNDVETLRFPALKGTV